MPLASPILHHSNPVFVPAKQHAAHLRAILAALQMAQPGEAVGLGEQIQHCDARQRRRGLFVLFSDCFGDLDEIATALRIVRARGHDVVVMHVFAPEELSFDFRRWSAFQSLEISGQRIHLDPPAVRQQYLERVRRFVADLEDMVVGLGGDYVRLTTAQDLADTLGWFLRNRMARRGGKRTMSFLSIAFLLAFPLAAAPLLLHWFDRRRNMVIQWGAMEFLMEASARKTSARRLKQWLLLLLRCLAIAALVFALARPLLPAGYLGQSHRSETIFVIDNSMSMMRNTPSGTMMTEAIDHTLDEFQNCRVGKTCAF